MDIFQLLSDYVRADVGDQGMVSGDQLSVISYQRSVDNGRFTMLGVIGWFVGWLVS